VIDDAGNVQEKQRETSADFQRRCRRLGAVDLRPKINFGVEVGSFCVYLFVTPIPPNLWNHQSELRGQGQISQWGCGFLRRREAYDSARSWFLEAAIPKNTRNGTIQPYHVIVGKATNMGADP
jgi:hypothetical protein